MAAVNDRATFGRDSVRVLQSRNRKSVSQRIARHRLIIKYPSYRTLSMMSRNSNSDIEEAEKSRVTWRVKRFERRVGGTGRGT